MGLFVPDGKKSGVIGLRRVSRRQPAGGPICEASYLVP